MIIAVGTQRPNIIDSICNNFMGVHILNMEILEKILINPLIQAIFSNKGLTHALYLTDKQESIKIIIKDFKLHSVSVMHKILHEFTMCVEFILKK